jgi:pectinesterase
MPVRIATLVAYLCIAAVAAAVAAAAAGDDTATDTPKPLPKIKIVLVGDSTVHDKSGWGPGFAKLLRPEAACVNLAQGGRSSKSFVD